MLLTIEIGVCPIERADVSRVAFKHPATASDLKNFYRSINALSADGFINGSAVALV
jgi:hypothetical protein